MSSLKQMLQNAAPKNQELLAEIAATEYAAAALQKNASYSADLQEQIKRLNRDLYSLHLHTEIERREHLKYHDSTFKRYAHKLRGSKGEASFTAKQEKEEREFNEAWQKERDAQSSKEECQHALDTAQNEKPKLEEDLKRYRAAQAELDSLYTSLFDGPTPEIPDEDGLEQASKQATQWANDTQTAFNAEKAAGEALRRVEAKLALANKSMDDALHYSRSDMIVGGHYPDIKKREALSGVQMAILESLRHMDEARRQQEAIKAFDDVNIDNGHILSDVVFDNIFSNMAMHDRIKSGDEQLRRAIKHTDGEVQKQLERAGEAKRVLKAALEGKEEARRELQNIRAEAFARVLSGGEPGGGEGLPPYQE